MAASLNQILLAVWRQSTVDGTRWIRVLFYGVVLIGLAVTAWLLPTAQMRVTLLCITLVFALFGGWVMLLANLLEQNHPTSARLVPGHLRLLRRAALMGWLLVSGLQGVLAWLALAGAVPLPPLLLAAAAVNVGVGWTQRHWMWAIVLYMGPMLIAPLQLQERLAGLWPVLAGAWQLQPWAWLALSLAALAGLLVRVFGSGDAAHRRGYARRQRMLKVARNGMTGNRAGLASLGHVGEWFSWPLDTLAARWLAHLLARARAGEASVMARTELALHGLQHWLRHLASLGLTLICVGLGWALVLALLGVPPATVLGSATSGVAIALGVAGFNPGFGLRNMLWHTRREQALLVLLPGMPQGGRLNRAVALLQLRHFLIAWLATTLLLGALAALTGTPSVLSLSMAALPLGILNLTHPPAAMTAPTSWTTSRPVMAFFLAYAVLWGLCALSAGLVWPLAGLSLALSGALLAWRWRRLVSATAALPAGRLA